MKYTSHVSSRVSVTDNKTIYTLLVLNVKFTPMDGTPLDDPTLYRQLVGSLVYLTVTCPNIAYVIIWLANLLLLLAHLSF